MTTPTDREALVKRITDYLWAGGLFNPELAIQDNVRNLLIDCRTALTAHGGEQTAEPVAWRVRIGDSPTWGYCDAEWQADFYGRQSGLKYIKEKLYAAPVAETEQTADTVPVPRAMLELWLTLDDIRSIKQDICANVLAAKEGK